MNRKLENIIDEGECLSLVKMKKFLEGSLSASELHEAENHLLHCELCSDAIDGLASLPQESFLQSNIDFINAQISSKIVSPVPTSSQNKYSFFNIRYAAAIALLILGAGAAYLLLNQGKDSKNENVAMESPLPVVKKSGELKEAHEKAEHSITDTVLPGGKDEKKSTEAVSRNISSPKGATPGKENTEDLNESASKGEPTAVQNGYKADQNKPAFGFFDKITKPDAQENVKFLPPAPPVPKVAPNKVAQDVPTESKMQTTMAYQESARSESLLSQTITAQKAMLKSESLAVEKSKSKDYEKKVKDTRTAGRSNAVSKEVVATSNATAVKNDEKSSNTTTTTAPVVTNTVVLDTERMGEASGGSSVVVTGVKDSVSANTDIGIRGGLVEEKDFNRVDGESLGVPEVVIGNVAVSDRKQNSDNDYTLLMIGTQFLRSNDPQKALTDFNQILDHTGSQYAEDAEYGKALALIMLHQEDQAKALLNGIVSRGGKHKSDAQHKLLDLR